jgi:hypothetical protein
LQHYFLLPYFIEQYILPTHMLAFCLLCAWAVPIGILVSLAANDNVLPTASAQARSQ